MKIIIIGGGITGLYIGYTLNKYNIDFSIYERSNHIGGKLYKNIFQIYPHQTNIINLLDELNIKYEYEDTSNSIRYDHKLFDLIRDKYLKTKQQDISVGDFLATILTKNEYNLFMSYIQPLKLDQMEISYYMKYQHENILAINQSNRLINVNAEIIDKLSESIQNNIIFNYNVKQITYMPITNNYLLTIDDRFVNADKIILTTNKNIQLIINKDIKSQLDKIQLFNWTKIKYRTKTSKNNLIDYISTHDDKLYKQIILNKILPNQLIDINHKTPIIKYTHIDYPNSYLICRQTLNMNFYMEYNLILALNIINSLEGSCIIANTTTKIILDKIYSKGSGYLYRINC
jgi:hypothetical protein